MYWVAAAAPAPPQPAAPQAPPPQEALTQEAWAQAAPPEAAGPQPAPPTAQEQLPTPAVPGPLWRVRSAELTRHGLVLETWFVQLAFLVPGVVAAVDLLAAHAGGASDITRFPTIIHNHPVANLILGVLSYLEVGAVVPLALLLLSRTGQTPEVMGLTKPSWRRDAWPGLGIAVSGYVLALVATIILGALLADHRWLISQIPTGHVPPYYIIYGIVLSAVTAITEETLVSGYLLTRLDQLGWNPRWALALSLTLRTSYHVYYGLGFLLTIPFGYYATRSFQKHRRLMRPIFAHFIYDAVLITISVLAS
ncbi:MAG TPA: CPBP family intramembrane glutamic endopeptidase [Streptosporangiaceae bacterium]